MKFIKFCLENMVNDIDDFDEIQLYTLHHKYCDSICSRNFLFEVTEKILTIQKFYLNN